MYDRIDIFISPISNIGEGVMKMLGSSKISGKLRITIPKDAAEVMGVKDGDHIIFYTDEKGNFQIKKG